MSRRFVHIGLTSLALFWLPGCSTDASTSSCAQDADCGSGAACYAATNTCMPLAVAEFGIEVLPPTNTQGWVRQEFVTTDRDLQLATAVSMQGTVSASNDETLKLPARVRMWRDSLIPGRPPIFYETDTQAPIDEGQKAGSYLLWLTPEHSYSLFVSPQAPYEMDLPPALEADIDVKDHTQKDVVLDGPDRSVEVRGQVVDATGKPVSAFPVQIRAYHEGGWLRSTLTRTCTGDDDTSCTAHCKQGSCVGAFAFRIPFGVRKYTIRAEPTADVRPVSSASTTELPVMECSDVALGLAAGAPQQQAVMTLGEPLRLPSFPMAQEYELSVVSSDDNTPIVGAQVSLQLDLPVTDEGASLFKNCRATFSRNAVTDVDGSVKLKLLPGERENRRYRLLVIPPSKSRYASLVDPAFEVGPTGGALAAIKLAKRLELAGTVVDAAGAPLVSARIEAEGIQTYSTSDGTPPTNSVAESDDDGSFTIFVDPGTYHIHVVPSANSGAPRFTWFSKEVTEPTSGFLLSAPEPRLLVGRLWRSVGGSTAFEPANGFTINAYNSAPKSSTELTAIVQATATTDVDGVFRFLVPR